MGDPAPARSLDDIDLSALRALWFQFFYHSGSSLESPGMLNGPFQHRNSRIMTHRSAEKTLLGSLSLWRWSAMEPTDRCTRVGMSRRGSWLPSRSWMSRRTRRKRSNRRSTC
ncbi:misshapen like kinase 1 [Homo sapiens]|uniref:Misshapen like kinase 1 n=1 Tax=Homo sapiens TaxID=9606 RepID=I3L4T2_HUMAN|nr:misshapen like kinase 1 [Homo sapiens]KAI4047257.1 misshapen like kinase 1 [Homo sapiens]